MKKQTPQEAYEHLKKFELECRVDKERFPEFFNPAMGYQEGDEKFPFFSEGLLYVLFGKEDARTILALIDNLARAADVNLAYMFDEPNA